MEKVYLYAIWDNEGKVFDNPFPAVSDLNAERRFAFMCEDGTLRKWPEQFDLWKIGSIGLLVDPMKAVMLKEKTHDDLYVVEQDLLHICSATKYKQQTQLYGNQEVIS